MSCKSRGFVLEIRWNVLSLIFVRFGAARRPALRFFAYCAFLPCAGLVPALVPNNIFSNWIQLISANTGIRWLQLISDDFRWFPLVKFLWCLLISIDFRWFLLPSAAFRCFPMLPGAFRWSPLIASDVHRFKLIIRCPLISIDVD